MVTWRIQIPAQEIEVEADMRPPVHLTVGKKPQAMHIKHVALGGQPECPHCHNPMNEIQWIQRVDRCLYSRLFWSAYENAWVTDMPDFDWTDYWESQPAYAVCGGCFERIEVAGDLDADNAWMQIEPNRED